MTSERYSDLAAALGAIERDVSKLERDASAPPRGGTFIRKLEPVQQVVARLELLRDEARLERLRICPGDNCGWLFLDFTGRRRWSSMGVCGSRAKMRRFYERQRTGRNADR